MSERVVFTPNSKFFCVAIKKADVLPRQTGLVLASPVHLRHVTISSMGDVAGVDEERGMKGESVFPESLLRKGHKVKAYEEKELP